MAIINMHDAKTQLSDLVARAEAGEEIVIARRNTPAVRLVPVGVGEGRPRSGKRRPGILAELLEPDALARLREAMKDIDWFEHAPDEYLSEEDIAAYYRKHPHQWDEMRRRVARFGETEQTPFDLTGLAEAVEEGREYTIMQGGKPVAKVVPTDGKRVRGFGMLAHLPPVPDDFFFDPLPEEELRAWEGEDAQDASKD